jgi:hypothetical protein
MRVIADRSSPESPMCKVRSNHPQQFLGLGLGLAVGSALGIALHNLALGISLGVAIGLVFGGARRRR